MNVKFLGHSFSPIRFYLQEREGFYRANEPADWLVSHGYRKLVTPEELASVPAGHAINCHIGYLPYGRGDDPNFWGWVAEEPHGITMHVMDATYDTGHIIAQEWVLMGEYLHTFRTSYHALQGALYRLFPEVWERIRRGGTFGKPQPPDDRPTRKPSDKVEYLQHLTNGWDTPVHEFLQRMRA